MRRLIDEQPNNPLGWLGEAGVLWWEADAEYALFKDTSPLDALFEEDVRKVLETSEPLLDSKDPARKADGHFAAGMALGVHGQMELARGRYLKAYSDGKKAIKHLKKCVKLDPDYHDAYLGLGIFDYQTDRLPAVLKLPMLFVHRGDAQRGLARMRQAMERGRFSKDQAAGFLLTILIREGDNAGALELLARLRAEFPRSAYLRYREAVVLARAGDWERSQRTLFALLADAPADPSFERKELSIFCGLAGAHCFERPYAEEAERWLDRALAEKSSARWTSPLLFWRGLARDVLGRRADAVQDYTRALAVPDVRFAHEHARHCLSTACDREETLRALRELARAIPAGVARAGAGSSAVQKQRPR